jgi:ribonuclease HI
MDPNAIKIYTDGSAFDNPGERCGFAYVIEFPDSHNKELEIYKETRNGSTINRMELSAVISAMRKVITLCNEIDVTRVIILTDSGYVNDNKNRAETWRKDKWRKADGSPADNDDLWQEFLSVRQKVRCSLDIDFVKGKSNPATKYVDKLAKQAAKEALGKRDTGYQSGKVSRSQLRGKSHPYDLGNKTERIKVYRYGIRGRNTTQIYRVIFEIIDEDDKAIEDHKFFAYTKSSVSRHGVYTVDFETNSEFPLFEVIEE